MEVDHINNGDVEIQHFATVENAVNNVVDEVLDIKIEDGTSCCHEGKEVVPALIDCNDFTTTSVITSFEIKGKCNSRSIEDLTAMLSSSQNATTLMDKQHLSTPNSTLDLPTVIADSKLQWAITMLLDSSVQQYFLSFLASRLRILLQQLTSTGDFASTGLQLSASTKLKLPFEDPLLRQCLQLYQLSDQSAPQFEEARPDLLRVLLPLLLVEIASHDASDIDAILKSVCEHPCFSDSFSDNSIMSFSRKLVLAVTSNEL